MGNPGADGMGSDNGAAQRWADSVESSPSPTGGSDQIPVGIKKDSNPIAL